MKASLKNARISPKKMNLVAGLVRGKSATEALNQLQFTPKKAANILYKVLTSAISNATTNFKQKKEQLYVKSILVTKGVTYKRGIPVSRGRYHPILKRNSNVVVEVALLEPTAPKSKKTEEKADEKKPATKKASKAAAPKAEKPAKKAPAKKSTAKKAPEAKKPAEKKAPKAEKKTEKKD